MKYLFEILGMTTFTESLAAAGLAGGCAIEVPPLPPPPPDAVEPEDD